MSVLNPNHVHAAMIHTHIEHLWQEYDTLAATGEVAGGDPSIWQLLLGAPVTNLDMEMAERRQRKSQGAETMRQIVAEVRAWEVKLREMGGGRVV